LTSSRKFVERDPPDDFYGTALEQESLYLGAANLIVVQKLSFKSNRLSGLWLEESTASRRRLEFLA